MNAQLPRWTVSFADLALLLLAFFILLQAGNARQVAAGARAAFSSEVPAGPLLNARAEALFEPGEARLKPAARSKLIGIGRAAAASGKRLIVDSEGRDNGARRFDAWELAAARAAATARALSQGGVAEDEVSIIVPGGREDKDIKGQRLIVNQVS
jgi:flagellar motor protein MotB